MNHTYAKTLTPSPSPASERRENAGRIVLLSPHLDDAIWSLGGAIPIWQQHHEVVIVTLCDGDPVNAATELLRQPAHRWRWFGTMSIRRRENHQAVTTLRCQHLSLGYCDAALRLHSQDTFEHLTVNSLFDAGNDTWWTCTPDTLLVQLRSLLHPNDYVIAPLAFGTHVDHCLTHALARHLPQTTAYYADFPYYQPHQAQKLIAHIAKIDLTLKPTDLACDLTGWIEAALLYRSQIIRLFHTRARFIEALTSYAHGAGTKPVCRIWLTR